MLRPHLIAITPHFHWAYSISRTALVCSEVVLDIRALVHVAAEVL